MDCFNHPAIGPAQLTLAALQAEPIRPWPAASHPTHLRLGIASGDGHIPRRMLQELSGDPRIRLAAQTRTLRESLACAALARCDVLLVEHELEDGSGLDLLSHLRRQGAEPRCVMISWMDDEEAALRAFESGAAGWLCLGHWCGDLVLSVLNVASGGAALSPSLARRLMRRPLDAPALPFRADPSMAILSEREREVLAQLTRGLRNKEIARCLTISDETVNAHLKSIYRKLQVHSRTQLVSLASRVGAL